MFKFLLPALAVLAIMSPGVGVAAMTAALRPLAAETALTTAVPLVTEVAAKKRKPRQKAAKPRARRTAELPATTLRT
jgi:hypothetical protein